ncbi:MAG: MarR family transcriptional regulator [Methanobrevibacter sp.]|nr:MarR family transcriptional regulator [Methanobrevibacter sp.]
MSEKLSEREKWEIIGYIKVSPTRYQILKTIEDDFLMPSEIARYTGLRITQVSNALHDLKKRNLVYCLNEQVTKGRLYQNTPLGLELLEMIEKNRK